LGFLLLLTPACLRHPEVAEAEAEVAEVAEVAGLHEVVPVTILPVS
jgi:hypothetical protein